MAVGAKASAAFFLLKGVDTLSKYYSIHDHFRFRTQKRIYKA